MSFFYDLNKKLDSIRATPEVTHQQLNERDMSRAAKGIMKYGKDGMQALRDAEAEGKALDPVRKKYNKYDNTEVDEGVIDTVKSVGKKVASGINRLVGHGSDEDMRKDLQRKSGAPVTGKKPAAGPKQTPIDPKDEYDYFTGRDKVRGGEQQVKEKLSPAKQKSFAALAPPTDKITFADKIAGAKKEVDEMLGDVAAEAMRSALGGGKGRNAGMEESAGGFTQADWDKVARKKRHLMMLNPNLEPEDAEQIAAEKLGYDYEEVLAWIEGNQNMEEAVKERSKGTAFDMSAPRAATPKVGSVERGHKHDIKHTATGRMVTRRVDDQGNSVGADDDSEASGEKRGRGRPKGTKQSIGAKGPSGKSKLMTKEGDVDVTDQGEYDQEGDMAKDDIKTIVRHAQALSKVLGDDDNLPEWVQSKLAKIEGMMISIDEYMQNQEGDDGEEEPIAEKAVSKQQQKFMGMAHAMQKGEKIKGASKELKKVAKTMKPKDTEDFAKTKHKGLPEKAPKKKKEEEVDESTTSGSVATSTATTGSKGGVFGKGIYDSMNRELENMIAESMSINMSDSTEGGKSLTVTATDEDAMKLAMMLKSAGVGGHDHDMHSGMAEAVDENSPDYPTNTQQAENNFGYAGGLNKPKTDVAGDGQTTIPNTAVHTQDEDALRRMMEMAGMSQNNQLDEGIMDMLAPYVKKAANALMSKFDPKTLQGLKQAHDQSGGDRNKFMAAIGITKQDLAPLAKDLQPVKEGVHDDSFSKAMFGSGTSLKSKVLTGIFNIVPTLGMTDLLTGGNIGSALTAATGGSVLQVIFYLVSAALIWGVGSYDFGDMDKEPTSLREDDLDRMMEMAGIKKKEVDEEKTDEGNKFAFNVLKAKEAGKKQADLDGDGDMEKVRESIFALTNQWKAYKG
jgi:hypothetical protein